MRVVFFGTPDFAVPTLRALLASSHAVVAAVTQPDRPSGRGRRVAEPPVKTVARAASVPVWQPERLKNPEWLEAIRGIAADIGVVAAYGRILPQVLIDLFPRGLVNVHASLLPRYRGASPIQRAVMNGDAETGVTIMRVVLALDAGPMLARVVRPIGPDEPADAVERDLAQLGATLLVDTLEGLERGEVVEVVQDETQATYAPRLTKEEGLIDWSLPAGRLHDRVRGLRPWPQAYTFLGPLRLVVLRGTALPDASESASAPAGAQVPGDVVPGTVLASRGDEFLVAAGQGTAYRVLELQPEGKRAMRVRDFLAGHPLPVGTRLGGPPA
jgi:methionyl-tRNA formyltransferase